MKGNKGLYILPGTLLLGFGLFYFFQGVLIIELFSWAAGLGLVGLAFLFYAYFGKQYDSFLPAALFIGIGVHLHLTNKHQINVDEFGLIFLFLACGFFLRYFKTKSGLFYGWVFLLFAIIQLFPDKMTTWLQRIAPGTINLGTFWPLFLILTGIYIFFFKRK